MQRIKTVKFWWLVVLAVLILSLLPVFGMAFYNHSSADDYSYGYQTRAAWIDTHNVLEVLKKAGEKVKTIYFEWQGSYAAVALFALQPAVFGEEFYPLTTFLLLGMFIFAVFYFFRKIVKNIFKDDVRIADIIAGVILLLSIQMLPSPVEGFFWWNGASYYVLFYSLMLIQMANLLVTVWCDELKKRQMAGLLILAVIITGGNYVSALLTVELTVLLFVYAIYKKKSISGKLIVVLAVTMTCFLINCLAPGNSVRQATFESLSPIRAVLYSYHEAYNHMVEWTSPLVIVGMIFLVPFLWHLPVQSKLKGLLPFAFLLGIEFSVFASSFTPTLYAYGSVGAGRIQNIRYFLWIFMCVAAEFTGICGIKSMVAYCEEKSGDFLKILKSIYSEYAIPFFIMIVFCASFFAGNSILADDVRDMTSVSAAKSLLSGEARQYDREAKERLTVLLGEESSVALKPYSCHPELLFWEDIKEDPADWVNCAVARFYGKEEVRLQ